ncbi:DUF7342 family protein [Halomarina rubra]|uniref:ArsR family transcriptional regulator n=1 Tax=Halomarina rubra TaxID=2071873 RepID=A0ABD6AUQ0_9EURY|nr:ArsR family transcriptional regulator [Halomarina rubra]
MGLPDTDAWKDSTRGRERVKLVVEVLEEPRSVSEIADRADVGWETAKSELENLVEANAAREFGSEGSLTYAPDPRETFFAQIRDHMQEYTTNELEAQLTEHKERLEELEAEFDVGTAQEYREHLADDGLSADELREIRNVAATWEALELEYRVVKHALGISYDTQRFTDVNDDYVPA